MNTTCLHNIHNRHRECAACLREALYDLVAVVRRMELEHEAERPSEEEYQAALAAAEKALGAGG